MKAASSFISVAAAQQYNRASGSIQPVKEQYDKQHDQQYNTPTLKAASSFSSVAAARELLQERMKRSGGGAEAG